ncbi:MAG TPA: YihY/virulence factor BrkB family protein [Candidatus Limnocylindria bacterium]|nr:YihY/virulence factor BrkB family protein [Candidatus Limnocylindria bacterium]
MIQASRSLWRLGGLSLSEFARRVYAAAFQHEIFDRAAALSYYFLFALFPTLLLLTALLGTLGTPHLMEELMSYGEAVLPPAVAALLSQTLLEVAAGNGTAALSAGAIGILWAASRGVRSVIVALNVVYAVERGRPWWRRQLVAVLLTLAFCVFTLTALALLAFGGRIGEAVAAWAGLGGVFTAVWRVVQWPLAILFGIIGMDLTYHLAPAARARLTWLSPGAVVAITGWVVTSLGMRIYVGSFADYNATYGSIGAVIVLMFLLYVSAAMLLVGAEVNAAIARAAAGGEAPVVVT